ncbi:MAG: hypothetical protein WAN93_07865 [Solirubrobacteraceae bacterium]
MSPSVSPHPCTTCFLYERRGVCPMAHDAYGLETPAEVQRRAELLRAAVVQDAQTVTTLTDRIHGDAARQEDRSKLTAPLPLSLPVPVPDPTPHASRKEQIHAVPS